MLASVASPSTIFTYAEVSDEAQVGSDFYQFQNLTPSQELKNLKEYTDGLEHWASQASSLSTILRNPHLRLGVWILLSSWWV